MLIPHHSIQEGLIFISMTGDDLLARTAHYQVREASPSRTVSPESLTGGRPRTPLTPRLPSFESNENRPPSRRTSDAADRVIPPPISNSSSLLLDTLSNPFRTASPLSFAITTECSDQSGDEEEVTSAATLADRFRRDHLSSNLDSSSESTEDGEDLTRIASSRARLIARQRRSSRQDAPSRIEIVEPDKTDETPHGKPEAGCLFPHARFFIERDKSMISIKFDPPV